MRSSVGPIKDSGSSGRSRAALPRQASVPVRAALSSPLSQISPHHPSDPDRSQPVSGR